MNKFSEINDHLTQIKVKTRKDASEIKSEAHEIVKTGKNVVVFFDTHYHMYFAPGFDPYQIRKEIDEYLDPAKPTETNKKKGNKKGADNKKITDKIDESEANSTPTKKKSFWDSLK